MRGKFAAVFTAASIAVSGMAVLPAAAQDTAALPTPRMMEYLDRGTVAMSVDNGIYLSWRLLGTENYNTAFDVYRDGEKIASVTDSTNYLDASGSSLSRYQIAPVGSGTENLLSDAVSPLTSRSNYVDIPIEKPDDITLPIYLDAEKDASGNILNPAHYENQQFSYTAGDAACGDIDGDGQYELLLKWDCNPQDSGAGYQYSGPVYIDAYKMRYDGEENTAQKLWRIALGVNIRGGEHYTQMSVYDLDGDGKAELYCKTAPGTLDGQGNYVTEASLDETIRAVDNTYSYVESVGAGQNGRILTGPEFFTVFDGETGAAIDTIAYPAPRSDGEENDLRTGSGRVWGDDFGNRADRFLATIAYLDGIHPSVVTWRGYYSGKNTGPGRTAVNAFNLVYDAQSGSKRLSHYAAFDTYSGAKYGYREGNEQYIGQGNHNLAVADVDHDGKDEIITGALCLDHDLTAKWCSDKGHGDALHLADYDPTHPGMEYFSVHESSPCGMTVYDADTGEVFFHEDGIIKNDSNGNPYYSDTGRGMMANTGSDPGYYQIWGANQFVCGGLNNFEATSTKFASSNFRTFWDGDLYDELLDNTLDRRTGLRYPTLSAYNAQQARFTTLFSDVEAVTVNSTKAVPALQADLFGDWREELVYPLKDYSALRVYTTNIQTNHKLYTLMHDPAYRMQVSAQNTAYNQPPHIGYYVSENYDEYDRREYAAYCKTPMESARTENIPTDGPVIDDVISVQNIQIIPDVQTTLYTWETRQLEAAVSPSDAYNHSVIWSSNDTSVAQISSTGLITPLKAGKTIISAVAADGQGAHAEISLTVSDIDPNGTDYVFDRTTGTVMSYTGTEEEVIIPETICGIPVSTVAETAFTDNRTLKRLVLSKNMTAFNLSALDGCTALKKIEVDAENAVYTSIDGVLYDKNGQNLLKYPINGAEEYTLPVSCKSIGTSAFAYSNIESVILNKADTISPNAFYGCKRLKTAEITEEITAVGIGAFAECSSLTAIHTAEKNPIYEERNGVLFERGDSTVRLLQYPAGKTEASYSVDADVQQIVENAFAGTTALKRLTIPKSVTVIEENGLKAHMDLHIYCYTGSFAETYAQENQLSYTALAFPYEISQVNLAEDAEITVQWIEKNENAELILASYTQDGILQGIKRQKISYLDDEHQVSEHVDIRELTGETILAFIWDFSQCSPQSMRKAVQ